MKNFFLFPVIVSLFIVGGVAHAQTTETASGITPDSPFYFLDRLGENLRELITFNKEAKARLQITFANERIAEIKVLVETKGPETRGIEKAQELLVGNVASAAKIVQEVKSSGKEVSTLAKELDDEFDRQERLLIQTFQEAQKKLQEERLAAIRKLIEAAQQAGDTDGVAGLKAQAQELVLSIAALKSTREAIKESFRSEKKKLEDELDEDDLKEDKQEEVDDDEDEELEDEELDDELEDLEIEDEDSDEVEDKAREFIRESAKQSAEETQRELEKALEDSDLTEAEREALKKAGEAAREAAKQAAEEQDEDEE
jgi:hypothetical protein